MNCSLCLELAIEASTVLDISSAEGQLLDVQRIVELHFWMRFDDIQQNATKFICRQCWEPIYTFHQFYVRIEQAHNPLEEIALKMDCDVVLETKPLPLLEPCDDSVEIKEEPDPIVDTNCQEEEAYINKRRRGRPRKSVKESVFKMSASESKESTLTSKRPRRKASSAQMNLCEKIIKTEIKQNCEKSEASESDNEAYNQPDVPDCDSDGDTENPSKPKTKRKVLVSREFDDYIASNFKLSCCLCNENLADFSVLKVHFRTKHKLRGYVYCCKKKFLKRGVLVDHLRTHEDPEYFKCPTCDKVMADRRCLDMHLKLHEGPRERVFQCEVCSKGFFKRAIYDRHVLMHMPEDQKKEICPTCNKAFPTKYILKQHMRLVHLNTYTNICDVCGKAIRGREALRRHMEEHSGNPPPPIQCELCGISVTTKYGLSRHMKAMHVEEYRQPLVCKICSKISPSLQAHKGHMKYMHNTERKHQCPMCNKAFKRPTALKEHLSTHTGEVLYACPHCPKTFNSNANMHSHRKKMHRAEWEARRHQRFKAQIVLQKMQDSNDHQEAHHEVEENQENQHEQIHAQPSIEDCKQQTNNLLNNGEKLLHCNNEQQQQ